MAYPTHDARVAEVERRIAEPMVDVSLFARREFTGGIVALMLWAFGLFGIYFFTSLYLQGVLGFSPTKAGAAFVPMAVLMAVSAIVSDRVAARFGAYRSTAVGMVAMGLGIASTALKIRFVRTSRSSDAFPSTGGNRTRFCSTRTSAPDPSTWSFHFG